MISQRSGQRKKIPRCTVLKMRNPQTGSETDMSDTCSQAWRKFQMMNVGGMFTTANHEMMKTPVRRRQRNLERAAVMNDVLEMENIAAEIDEAQNLLYSI
jgi:hypothetical protein